MNDKARDKYILKVGQKGEPKPILTKIVQYKYMPANRPFRNGFFEDVHDLC